MLLNKHLLNYLNSAVSAGAGILLVPYYVSLAGIDGYGIYAKTMLMLSALLIFDVGFSSLILRLYGSRDFYRSGKLVFTLFLLSLYALALLVLMYYVDFFWIFDINQPQSFFYILPIYIVSKIVDDIFRSLLLGSNLISRFALLGLVGTLFRYAALTTWFFNYSASIQLLLVFLCAVNILTVIFGVLVSSGEIKLSAPNVLKRGDIHYMLGAFFLGILSFAFLQIDKLFAASEMSDASFAMYSIASSISGFLLVGALPLTQRFNTLLLRRRVFNSTSFSWSAIYNLYRNTVLYLTLVLALLGPIYLNFIGSTGLESIVVFLIILFSYSINVQSWLQFFIFHVKNKLFVLNMMQMAMIAVYLVGFWLFKTWNFDYAPLLALLTMHIIGFLVFVPFVLNRLFSFEMLVRNFITFGVSIVIVLFAVSITFNVFLTVVSVVILIGASLYKTPLLRFLGLRKPPICIIVGLHCVK